MRDYEDYERGEEIKALGQVAKANLDAILETYGAETVADLARGAYKYTSCGAALGASIYSGEDTGGRWVYSSHALHELTPSDFVMALSVSSIVEGVDQTTETHIVDLFDDAFETPEHAVEAYGAALDAVEKEADEIWRDTHGCPTCAEHFGNVSLNGEECEGDDGMTPIWDECPDCRGCGSAI